MNHLVLLQAGLDRAPLSRASDPVFFVAEWTLICGLAAYVFARFGLPRILDLVERFSCVDAPSARED